MNSSSIQQWLVKLAEERCKKRDEWNECNKPIAMLNHGTSGLFFIDGTYCVVPKLPNGKFDCYEQVITSRELIDAIIKHRQGTASGQ